MSEYKMYVYASQEQLAEFPDLFNAALLYAASGGVIERDGKTGTCLFKFDEAGLRQVTLQYYTMLYNFGVRVEQAKLHLVLTAAEFHGPMPEQLPYSTITEDVEGEPITRPRTWAEYYTNVKATPLADGTYLVTGATIPPGMPSGDYFRDADWRLWFEVFGARLLMPSQAMALPRAE